MRLGPGTQLGLALDSFGVTTKYIAKDVLYRYTATANAERWALGTPRSDSDVGQGDLPLDPRYPRSRDMYRSVEAWARKQPAKPLILIPES